MTHQTTLTPDGEAAVDRHAQIMCAADVLTGRTSTRWRNLDGRARAAYRAAALAELDRVGALGTHPAPVEPQHVGGDAEHCPACRGALDSIAYPWICPGPDADTGLRGRIRGLLDRDGEFSGCPDATTDQIMALIGGTPSTTTPDAGLREQYAAALEQALTAWDADVPGSDGPLATHLADAVLAARDDRAEAAERRAEQAETALCRARDAEEWLRDAASTYGYEPTGGAIGAWFTLLAALDDDDGLDLPRCRAHSDDRSGMVRCIEEHGHKGVHRYGARQWTEDTATYPSSLTGSRP